MGLAYVIKTRNNNIRYSKMSYPINEYFVLLKNLSVIVLQFTCPNSDFSVLSKTVLNY